MPICWWNSASWFACTLHVSNHSPRHAITALEAMPIDRLQGVLRPGSRSTIPGKGIAGLKPEMVLGYFVGDRKKQLAQYREYVEGVIGERQRYDQPMATKQMFIGDEEFIDKAKERSATAAVREGHYSLSASRAQCAR